MLDNFEIYAELESSHESSDKYTNIGNLLRNRRLDLNLSIDTLAQTLRLSPKYIQLVEDGNYADVSQRIYYFGYIRNISRYLKLDEEVVLKYLVEEVKTDDKILSKNMNISSDLNILTKNLASNTKKTNYKNYILYLILLTGFCIGGFIIKQQSDMKENSSSLMLRHQSSKE